MAPGRSEFRSRAVVAALVAVVAVAVVLAIVLRDGGTDVPAVEAAPSEDATESPATSPTPSDPSPSGEPALAEVESFEGELWFVSGERLSFGTTILPLTDPAAGVAARLERGSPAQRAGVALEALLAGPPAAFEEVGDDTAIPAGTRLLDVEVADGTAVVDLSEEFVSGGGSLSMQLRVAQVVYTATQVEGIDGVLFEVDGKAVDALGGEGVIVDRPQNRSDFPDLAPPIVLMTPKPGARLSGKVVVKGNADVFEANVAIRLLADDGKALVETFTTAICGSGCRGGFSKQIQVAVDREQGGRLEVLTYSAEDGSRQHVISIPVTLVP